MSYAIEITALHKELNKNLLSRTIIGAVKLYPKLPTVWQGGYADFYPVEYPILKQYQRYLPLKKDCFLADLEVWLVRVQDFTPEEIAQIITRQNIAFMELLKTAVARLEYGAKRKAIGKEGSQQYIETQERIYLRKYQIATNTIPDTGGLIEAEAADFGFSLEAYKKLIIKKYEGGKALFDMLTAMIEYARSKALLFVETNNLPKANEVLHYMDEVAVSNTLEELTEVLTAIKNL